MSLQAGWVSRGLIEARLCDEVDGHLRPHHVLVEQRSHHDYLYKRIAT